MLNWIPKLIDRMFSLVGALLFSQAPLFMQQYQQQLLGHVNELSLQIESMRIAAKHSGKTLEQYIQKFTSSSDIDFAHQGEIMTSMVNRWQQFSSDLVSLQDASVLTRPFVFIYRLSSDIFNSTIHNFSIGIPLTYEGMVYALVGLVVGYLTFSAIDKLFRFLSLRRQFGVRGLVTAFWAYIDLSMFP